MHIYNDRNTFYQWDLNQRLIDKSFKIGEKYHIGNTKYPETFVVKTYDYNGSIVIDVPNILLQHSFPIIVYKCIETDDSSYTYQKYTFGVKQRPKPSDYIYTQTEVLSYENLDKRLTELENSSEDSPKVDLDATLSEAGKAADAKAVGDAISNLSEEIADCIKSPVSVAVGQTIKVSAVDESGKPTEWKAVDLPEQVQPDWNQNDSTAADYVKNRPFYSDTAEIEIVTEAERENLLKGFPAFAVGDTVTVKVDGMEHSLVAYEDEGLTIIGDTFSSLVSGEGQLGWSIIFIENKVAIFFATEAHTVAYLGINHHKIDQKYLPTQRVTFTKSYHNDGALDDIMSDEEVLDSVILDIPVLKASSYPTDQIVCSPNGTLFLYSKYISLGTFEPDRIEINSNTLTSETFELVVPGNDICKLTVLDIYTKTRCHVYFPMLDKVGSDSSVGTILNTFTQSVAYINGHLFSFCTSSLSSTGAGRTIVLTVKKIL